jgi:hypothetical protein
LSSIWSGFESFGLRFFGLGEVAIQEVPEECLLGDRRFPIPDNRFGEVKMDGCVFGSDKK